VDPHVLVFSQEGLDQFGLVAADVQVVQNNLGHASVGTTSMYLTTERDVRTKAMRGFWRRDQTA
jgi:site-specific recombinase XerD